MARLTKEAVKDSMQRSLKESNRTGPAAPAVPKKVCKFYLRGKCNKGEACEMLHDSRRKKKRTKETNRSGTASRDQKRTKLGREKKPVVKKRKSKAKPPAAPAVNNGGGGGGGGVPAQPGPTALPGDRKKRVGAMPCFAFSRKNCNKGKSCRYEHRNLTKEEIQKRDAAEKECATKGNKAPWLNPPKGPKGGPKGAPKDKEGKGGKSERVKDRATTPCVYYHNKGGCALGDACQFSHK